MRCGLALTVGLIAAVPAMAADLGHSPASPSAGQIDDYLTRKHSPLAGMGSVFEGYGRDYDVDPRLVVAIAGAETTFGRHQCTANNAWNWFHRRTCPPSAFSSYQAGAERVTRFMRRSYINRGYDSIELIRHKYCASGCDNWVPLVTRFHAEMPAGVRPGPVPAPTGPPVAGVPATGTPAAGIPATASGDGNRLFGVPLYLVFFGGAAFVAAWALRALRR